MQVGEAEIQTEASPGRYFRNPGVRFALLAAFTFFAYWLCLRFLYPRYFAPLAPFHQDFYDYVGVVRNRWGQVVLYPRPITFLIFKLIGYWDIPFSMAIGIGVALTDVLLILRFAERIWPDRQRATWVGAALYLVILFSHPQFYFEHRHDMPAFFSLLFLMLALHLWLSWLQKSQLVALLSCAVCIAGFSFTKEAFFVSLLFLVLPLFYLHPRKGVQTAVFLAVCCFGEISAFLLSKARSSPFVNPGSETTGPYYIDTRVASLWHVFSTYLLKAFSWPGAALLTLTLVLMVARPRRLFVALTFVAAGLAALLPLSVLPNHVFSEYAWMAVPLVFVPVAYLPFAGWRSVRPWALGALSLLLLVKYEAKGKQAEKERDLVWYLEQEKVGRSLFASLRGIGPKLDPARHVLVTGITTPFLPWGVDAYTEWRFGNQRYWSILTADDESARSSRLVEFQTLSQVDPRWVEAAMVYDSAGHLSQIVRGDDSIAQLLASIPGSRKPQSPAVKPVLVIETLSGAADQFGHGTAKLRWEAPAGMVLQVRVGAIDGPLLGGSTGSGSATTGPWVTEGMNFYLQDVSGGKDLNVANTVAEVTAHVAAGVSPPRR